MERLSKSGYVDMGIDCSNDLPHYYSKSQIKTRHSGFKVLTVCGLKLFRSVSFKHRL